MSESADQDERPWFAFSVAMPHLGLHEAATNYVPADDEASARRKMRDTLHPKLADLADAWPLVGTRFCSREALTRSLLRAR